MAALIVSALEHEKSFLLQDGASLVQSIAVYQESLLMTVSNDIVQKNIRTGAIKRTFRAHMNTIYSFVVTEDSRMISSAYDDMIIVWDLETGSILKRIRLRSSDTFVRSIIFQDDQVFAGGYDERVRQVDLFSGRVVKTISLSGQVYYVTAGSDSLFVAKNVPPYVVKLNIESGATILRLNGHTVAVYSLFVWNNLLFSGSADRTIICWNSVNGEIIRVYVGHSADVFSVAVFDQELYSSGSKTELFKWNTSTGQLTKKFDAVHQNNIHNLAYKSQALFTGSMDKTVIQWDALSLWGSSISGGEDAESRLWDTSSDSIEPFSLIDNNFARINVYLFEDCLYSGDNFGDVKVISLARLTLVRIIKDVLIGPVSLLDTIHQLSCIQKGVIDDDSVDCLWFANPLIEKSFMEMHFGNTKLLKSIHYEPIQKYFGKTNVNPILLERSLQLEFDSAALSASSSDWTLLADVGGMFHSNGLIDITVHGSERKLWINEHILRFKTNSVSAPLMVIMTEYCLLIFTFKKTRDQISGILALYKNLFVVNFDDGFKNAQLYSNENPEVGVLTDLNDFWIIAWLEKSTSSVKTQRNNLMPTNVTGGVAVGFLRYHLKAFFMLDSDYKEVDKKAQKSRPTFKAVTNEEISLTSTECQDGEDEPVDVGIHLIKQLIRDNPGYAMSTRRLYERVKAEIADIQPKLTLSKKKVERPEEKMNKAVGKSEIQIAIAFSTLANAGRTRFWEEELRLMEQQNDLLRKLLTIQRFVSND
ncbi:hypothetical protein MP638_005093 [Amoeboaphelidium occidentale]|nr:hypothetical protein MP638_005093 [Amoeboaphelidium occidentale]